MHPAVPSPPCLGEGTQACVRRNFVGRFLLEKDPLNIRTLKLFAEVQQARHDPEPVRVLRAEIGERLNDLPTDLLSQFAEILSKNAVSTTDDDATEQDIRRAQALSPDSDTLELLTGASKVIDLFRALPKRY